MISFVLAILTSGITTTLLALGVAACTVVVYLANTVSQLVPYKFAAHVLIVVGCLFVGFNLGYQSANDRYENEILKAELAFKQRQILISEKVAETAQGELKKLTDKDAELETKVKEYEDYISQHPNNACRATSDDIKRLRSIK